MVYLRLFFLFFFSVNICTKHNKKMAEPTEVASSLPQDGAVIFDFSLAEAVPEPSEGNTEAQETNSFQQPNFEDTQSFLEEVNFKLETLKEVIGC